MIIDQSRSMSGISISRLSEYLSLCKIDCLVRKVDSSTPSHRVDQPSKVGQVGTMARPNRKVKPVCFITFNFKRKLGSKTRTLLLKDELGSKLGIRIDSLTEAGTTFFQQEGKELEVLPLYKIVSCADNFADKRKEWKVCLVLNKQDQWVNAFLNSTGLARLQSDYLINIRQGQIQHYKVPKS